MRPSQAAHSDWNGTRMRRPPWPRSRLQLLIDEVDAVHVAANAAGLRFFTCGEAFKRYMETELLATGLKVA